MMLLKPSLSVAHCALLSIALAMAAQPALARTIIEPPRVPTDVVDALLNQPMIPLPDTEEFTIGNRAQIQANTPKDPATQRMCDVYKREAPKVDDEVAKARTQKAQYEAFFKQMRPYLNELALQRDAALRLLQVYKERQMGDSQIALLQRQAQLLDQRLKQEQERRAQAQRNYEKVIARQAYYMNIDDFFPDCYVMYPHQEDPEVDAAIRAAIVQQKAAQASSTTTAPAAPATNTRPVSGKRVQ